MYARIGSLPGGGITSMRPLGTVYDRPNPLFLKCGICKRFTISVLAVPDSLRHSILEPDHVVLPIPNMISNFLAQNRGALVVCVKVQVECVDIAASVIIDDNRGADCSVGLASTIRLDTFKPRRIGSDIVEGGEVNISASKTI